MVVAAFETQDSAVFQFEKDNINDTFKINDTLDISAEIAAIEKTDKDEYLKKKKIYSPISDIVKDTKIKLSSIIIPSATHSLIRKPKEESNYTDIKSKGLFLTKIKRYIYDSLQNVDSIKPESASQINIKFEQLIKKLSKMSLIMRCKS